jgi:Domain of unknown function (DUF4136)
MAAAVVAAVQFGTAAIDTRSAFDKAFDFTQAHTWAWNPKGAGEVVAARTKDDDPQGIKRRAEPIIMSAASVEMPRRGLTAATAAPDLTLTYYLLLTIGDSRQVAGQFLPAVAQWGIPPFTPQTTALEYIPTGSLVLDLAAKGEVVWRGVGEGKIDWDLNEKQREKLVRDAVKKILDRYPPKKK